jgi:nucleoside-diphosphate-sugar epimerase
VKVFIQGATGVLGRRLVKEFAARGHAVVGTARSDGGAAAVREAGGEPVRVDVFDEQALVQAADGCQVVIRAATAIPRKPKFKVVDFVANDRLRTEGTRALLAAARRVGARVFLQESIVWIARPADGAPFDERTPVQGGGYLEATRQAEELVRNAAGQGGLVATTLRLGNFYAADAYHTRMMGERLAAHKLPVIGIGDSVLSLLHADDAATAFVAAAEAPRSGLFHVVDNEPPRVRDLLDTFASKLGARPPGSAPAWLARLVAGKETTRFFTVSMRTSNARFREAFAWQPRYSTYREGLDQIVQAWRNEGFPSGSFH